MSKELVISATPHETRVAIVEDGQLCEIYIEREKEFALVGSLYKGRVTRVLPGMQSAFVDIGLDSDAFLYVSDFLENLEDYDHVAPPPAPSIEAKPQLVPSPENTVYPPTTNGGTTYESGSEPAAAPVYEASPDAVTAEPEQSAAQEFQPQSQPQSLSQPSSQSQGAPSAPSSRPPFEQRNDRGRGGFQGRNDRSNDRGGRNRRWGRQGGGRDRRPGRDLPPSKYASPKPFESRPHEAQPYEPPPADYEPIILPGESLAKYKDRIPSPPAAPASSASAESAAPQVDAGVALAPAVAPPEAPATEASFTSSLPSALFAAPESESRVESAPAAEEQIETPAVTASGSIQSFGSVSSFEPPAEITESLTEEDHHGRLPEEAETNGHSLPGLTDEEVATLAEQVAEAKHEEAQAEAAKRSEALESAADSFVEEAEIEDLQEAFSEDEGTEPEVTTDEMGDDVHDQMHDEALAAAAHEDMHGEDESPDAPEASAEGAPEISMDAAPAPEAEPTSARISEQPRARFQRPMRRGGRNRGGRRGGRPNDHRPSQHAPQHSTPRPPQHSSGHSSQHAQQHRRPQLISEMLKAGQEIIVQIAKEPLGKKGARITSHVALPGRFLVYMPTVDHIGVSRRIGSSEDRSRLRRLVNEAKGTFPGGFIVRTAAGEATDDEIRTDVEFLGRTWDAIRASSEQRHAPALLHRDLNLVQRILRDYLSDDYVAIWLDSEEEFSKVVEFVGRFQPNMVNRVKLYTKESPIFEEFGIQQELDKALRPKVWLKSGGYIVINHTEALVAIDVNTGKFVGRGSTRLEDTIVKTNLEAVKEIVRQIRLRDLGGIIVLDLIDMEDRRNREKVLSALEHELNQDRAPSKALNFNEFGLVCITRKRTKQALERVLCQPCPYCTGSGMVKSIPTICYEIQVEARKMAADLDARSITLRVNPEIAKSLKTREASLVDELEQATRKSVIIQSDPTLHWEQYDIY
jgi:Rne/Rng family ribonuclease